MAQLVKNLSANVGDTEDVSLKPESGRSPGEGNGYTPWGRVAELNVTEHTHAS